MSGIETFLKWTKAWVEFNKRPTNEQVRKLWKLPTVNAIERENDGVNIEFILDSDIEDIASDLKASKSIVKRILEDD